MIPISPLTYDENKQQQITGVFLPLGKETVELVHLSMIRKQISKAYDMKNEVELMMIDEDSKIKLRQSFDFLLSRLYLKYNKFAQNYEKDYLRKWMYMVEDAAAIIDRFNGRMSLPRDKRTRVGDETIEETDIRMRNFTTGRVDETFFNLLRQGE